MRFPLIPLIAAAVFGQDSGIKNPYTTPADVTAGAKIFRVHCAECHGLKGEGGRGPNLTTGVSSMAAATSICSKTSPTAFPAPPCPPLSSLPIRSGR